MSDETPMIEELPGEPRIEAVSGDMTISEFCRESIIKIIEHDVPAHSYQCLHEGVIYYIDVMCSAIKPPYTRLGPDDVPEGEKIWLGQRLS